MPQYNRAELGRMATESGFVRDTFEKVLRLKEILKFLNEDKSLREHLLLKGGTAINLTVFNIPRLSVDIDMDYTPNDTREGMLECRAKITDIIKEYMESEGYQLSETSVYKGYKRDKIEMRGDRAEISDFPLYLNTVAGGLDCRDQTIGGFSFVVKIYAVPVVEIIG